MHTAVSQGATEALPKASRVHAEHGSQFTLADSQQPFKKKKKKKTYVFVEVLLLDQKFNKKL